MDVPSIICVIIIILSIFYSIIVEIYDHIDNQLKHKYEHTIELLSSSMCESKKEVDSLKEQLKHYKYLHDTKKETELLSSSICELEKEVDSLKKQLKHYKYLHDTRKETLEKIFSSNLTAFPFLAGMIADYTTYDLEILAQSLNWGNDKKRLKKVASIREIRNNAKELIEESRTSYYQLEYLKKLFPTIEDYLETDYSDLLPSISIDKLSDYDYRRDYLSKDEWDSLNETAKNQLVLDRYIESHSKTKWQIGRDYELYVGYTYLSQGYDVDYFGTIQKFEDMGRDLIVKKDNKIAIVQCKYWSTSKLIHEKHIAQLYGTSISYCIENNLPFDCVIPILITNTNLSDVAKQMAEHLNVRYKENFEMKEFPRIKCNIGKDKNGSPTKIYHLPTDQQYDSVKLVHSGEFFAFTVEEAEKAGFRHAYRWHSK